MNRVKLTAPEGMILTNGETYGREIFLGTGDSPDNWHAIPEAEYQATLEKQNKEEETA